MQWKESVAVMKSSTPFPSIRHSGRSNGRNLELYKFNFNIPSFPAIKHSGRLIGMNVECHELKLNIPLGRQQSHILDGVL